MSSRMCVVASAFRDKHGSMVTRASKSVVRGNVELPKNAMSSVVCSVVCVDVRLREKLFGENTVEDRRPASTRTDR